MRVTLLPSTFSLERSDQFLTTFLVNDTMAIDAGSLGLFGTPEQQAHVRHVVITHTHLDHIASLPIFVENAYNAGPEGVTVYGSTHVLRCLRQDVFNGRVWPDFLKLSPPDAPFMKFELIDERNARDIDGLRCTSIAVDHLVPTLGLIVEEPGSTVVFPSDTGPTEAIWHAANAAPNLKAVFLEVAFPNALLGLAQASRHLTPMLFAGEVAKLKPGVRVLAIHLKPRYFEEITAEVAALGLPQVEICRPGVEYVL
jgi:ribonuclease BN (tRNA processing enzyme)